MNGCHCILVKLYKNTVVGWVFKRCLWCTFVLILWVYPILRDTQLLKSEYFYFCQIFFIHISLNTFSACPLSSFRNSNDMNTRSFVIIPQAPDPLAFFFFFFQSILLLLVDNFYYSRIPIFPSVPSFLLFSPSLGGFPPKNIFFSYKISTWTF